MTPPLVRDEIPVGLSTASVYPQNTEAAFVYAAELGFDGVELMVWGEPVSQDIKHVEYLSERYQVPVLSVHAPCLLISQRVWGRDPLVKLGRSVQAAEDLGAQTVVVHPPRAVRGTALLSRSSAVRAGDSRRDVSCRVLPHRSQGSAEIAICLSLNSDWG